MPTKNMRSRIESEDSFEELAPASRGASPEGERSEAPARAAAGPRPLAGLPGGGSLERPELSDELIDELLAGARTAEEIAGPDGLLRQLTRRLLERALQAEITEHLGYPAGQAPPGGAGNARNGQPPKTVLTDSGPVRVRSPRDRKGTFEPQIVGKRQTRWVGFDDRVIALRARDDGARDPGVPGRDLWHRRQPGPDLEDHRRRPGGRQGVADAPAGERLRDRLPRRDGREDPRRRRGAQFRLLSRDRRQPRRRARRARDLVSACRGRQVLAASPDRPQDSRRRRRARLLHRRADRLPPG